MVTLNVYVDIEPMSKIQYMLRVAPALRGKSSRRSRQYSCCARRASISAGIPSVSDFVRVSKRSRMSTTFRWVAGHGTGISTLDKSTGAASITFVPFATFRLDI